METVYIGEGIPERFDYEIIEEKTNVFDSKTNSYIYKKKIEVWHIEGYKYQNRTYVGIFNNVNELRDYMIDLEIV